MDKEEILRRAKKIFARTQEGSGCTPEEISVAMGILKKTLEKYQLTMMNVNAGTIDGGGVVELKLGMGKRKQYWKTVLSCAVGKGYDCSILNGRDIFGVITMYFVGYRSDAEIAQYVFESLLARLPVMAKDSAKRRGIEKVSRRLYMNNYLTGAAESIYFRMKDRKTKAQQPSHDESTALVVMKDQHIEEFLAKSDTNIKSKEAKSMGSIDPEGLRDGMRDGYKIPLHDGLTADAPRAAIPEVV